MEIIIENLLCHLPNRPNVGEFSIHDTSSVRNNYYKHLIKATVARVNSVLFNMNAYRLDQ